MGIVNCKRKDADPSDKTINAHDPCQQNNGLRVTIHSIKDYVPDHPFRITCSVTEEGIIILDEEGFKCSFNTTVHQSSKQSNASSITSIDSLPKSITPSNSIIINESAHFTRNLHWILKNQNVKRNLYLSFQIFQKKDRKKTEGSLEDLGATLDFGEMVSLPTLPNSKSEEPSKPKLIAWILFKLNTADNSIVGGRFTSRMIKPPFIRPPVKKGTMLTPADMRIEFSVE